MDGERYLLIVEDDVVLLKRLAERGAKLGRVIAEASLAAATRVLEADLCLYAMLVDSSLPDGKGLDFIAAARQKYRDTPAALYTGSSDPENINRAFHLRVAYVCKPGLEHVDRFLREALAPNPARAKTSRMVREYANLHSLSTAETELLEGAVCGVGMQEYLERRDIKESTYRSQVQSILRRTHAPSFASVRESILRRVHGA